MWGCEACEKRGGSFWMCGHCSKGVTQSEVDRWFSCISPALDLGWDRAMLEARYAVITLGKKKIKLESCPLIPNRIPSDLSTEVSLEEECPEKDADFARCSSLDSESSPAETAEEECP